MLSATDTMTSWTETSFPRWIFIHHVIPTYVPHLHFQFQASFREPLTCQHNLESEIILLPIEAQRLIMRRAILFHKESYTNEEGLAFLKHPNGSEHTLRNGWPFKCYERSTNRSKMKDGFNVMLVIPGKGGLMLEASYPTRPIACIRTQRCMEH